MSESSDVLGALFQDHRERSGVILAAYYAMPWRKRERVALAYYFCPAKSSCPLLTVWQSPRGRLGAIPNYKLSHGVNERESTENGRRANTRDGANHWKGTGVVVDDLPASSNLPLTRRFADRPARRCYNRRIFASHGEPKGSQVLTCKHYRGLLDVGELLEDLAGATPGLPARRVVARLPRLPLT